MKTVMALLLTAAIPAVATAQTARQCLPQDQAAALVTFALPVLMTRLGERCRPELPASAYLSMNAQRLADRYRPDSAAAWPRARMAIARLISQFLGQPMPPEMDGEAVRFLAEPAIGTLLAERVKPADCAVASEAMATISPLSGREIGRLAALAAAVADRKGQGIAGVLSVCKPEAGR